MTTTTTMMTTPVPWYDTWQWPLVGTVLVLLLLCFVLILHSTHVPPRARYVRDADDPNRMRKRLCAQLAETLSDAHRCMNAGDVDAAHVHMDSALQLRAKIKTLDKEAARSAIVRTHEI